MSCHWRRQWRVMKLNNGSRRCGKKLPKLKKSIPTILSSHLQMRTWFPVDGFFVANVMVKARLFVTRHDLSQKALNSNLGSITTKCSHQLSGRPLYAYF